MGVIVAATNRSAQIMNTDFANKPQNLSGKPAPAAVVRGRHRTPLASVPFLLS
jgi:hypothetical protein